MFDTDFLAELNLIFQNKLDCRISAFKRIQVTDLLYEQHRAYCRVFFCKNQFQKYECVSNNLHLIYSKVLTVKMPGLQTHFPISKASNCASITPSQVQTPSSFN